MIVKLLITTLIPREATQEKGKRKFENTTRKSEEERKTRIQIKKEND